MSLLVSVIIPSAGHRPQLLERAIKSALIDNDTIQTEIIVVLNGKDGMLFNTEKSFQHPLLKYYKIEQGNVSKGRNYGLFIAKGDLIRFLDDDDFLFPEIAEQQYLELINSDADLSTYAGAIEDEYTRYQVIAPINLEDYCAATLSAYCPALTFASVYKSNNIKNLKWDEGISVVEDEKWMRNIAANTEIKWIRSDEIVAVWYQHDVDRLSLNLPNPKHFFYRCNSIIETVERLKKTQRLTNERLKFAFQGLWSCIHHGFYFSPFYWSKMAFYARSLDSRTKPHDSFFDILPQFIHPLIIEWLMLPKRWLTHQIRKVKNRLGLHSYIRKI